MWIKCYNFVYTESLSNLHLARFAICEIC